MSNAKERLVNRLGELRTQIEELNDLANELENDLENMGDIENTDIEETADNLTDAFRDSVYDIVDTDKFTVNGIETSYGVEETGIMGEKTLKIIVEVELEEA